jgi:hypothetical protein
MKLRLQHLRRLGVVMLISGSVGSSLAQEMPKPPRVWSVGPLTKGTPVMGISFGTGGATVTGPHADTQTGSIFAATRSVVFAGDRVVLASRVGMREVEGAQVPAGVYQLLSLDVQNGEVKSTREFLAFNSLKVFATNDAHVIVSGRNVMRLTPDLKDAGSLEFGARGHKSGTAEDIQAVIVAILVQMSAIEMAPPRPRQQRRCLRSLSISTKTIKCYPAQLKSLGGVFNDRLTEPELFCERPNNSLPLQGGAPIGRRSSLPRSPFCT